MPAAKLKAYLDSNNVKYLSIPHSTAYTAQGIAAVSHISGKELAKTVMVNADDKLIMAVLPASKQVDLLALRKLVGAESIRLASEREFKTQFPDCEVGAMPPFGNLYDLRVFVDETLTKDEEIAFNAGSHTELIRLAYGDFERLVQPTVGAFSRTTEARAA